MKSKYIITPILGILTSLLTYASPYQVTIENISPTGGVGITPPWIGFHDGSFDSYDGGSASASALESLAEDGDTSPLSIAFLAGGTLAGSGSQASGRIDSTLADGGAFPGLLPGESVSQTFGSLDLTGNNRYFSYVAMILPSNDYYVANGDPTSIDLSSLSGAPAGTQIQFFIGAPDTVNDAGTEINDFDFSAGNGLFSLSGGQTSAGQGNAQSGVNANVSGDPFAAFLNNPGGLNSNLNFNNYTNGLGQITISVIPEPSTYALIIGLISMGLLVVRKKIKTKFFI